MTKLFIWYLTPACLGEGKVPERRTSKSNQILVNVCVLFLIITEISKLNRIRDLKQAGGQSTQPSDFQIWSDQVIVYPVNLYKNRSNRSHPAGCESKNCRGSFLRPQKIKILWQNFGFWNPDRSSSTNVFSCGKDFFCYIKLQERYKLLSHGKEPQWMGW